MFFEPVPVEEEPDLEPPEWVAPPGIEIGSVVPVELVVVRSTNAAVVLPTVRAYRTGCLLEVEVACRQGSLSAEDWWDLSGAAFRPFTFRGGRLPDRLMRFGVRYRDGTKATWPGRARGRVGPGAGPPEGPQLRLHPRGGGGPGPVQVNHFGLWLWPLPPAEPVEFAVEWPAAGIDLTFVGLDGAAMVAAARRSPRYWIGG